MAATLDIISDGRVDFGIGEGATRLELAGFRIPAKEKRAMPPQISEEVLAKIERELDLASPNKSVRRRLARPPLSSETKCNTPI
jgi:alkanesulfonate monooxygenase SsuD/methylene tetrahydromethanopterin reductase-like flavin-dependent oxidoreductase (luciferase family)